VTTFTSEYLAEALSILGLLDQAKIERLADLLVAVRERGGRLFILGVGGGAGHASHAVNDFLKIARIESYSPSDNVSELTARTNDEGWDTAYSAWLEGSRLLRRQKQCGWAGGRSTSSSAICGSRIRSPENRAPMLFHTASRPMHCERRFVGRLQ